MPYPLISNEVLVAGCDELEAAHPVEFDNGNIYVYWTTEPERIVIEVIEGLNIEIPLAWVGLIVEIEYKTRAELEENIGELM